jgi:hypothetical protein
MYWNRFHLFLPYINLCENAYVKAATLSFRISSNDTLDKNQAEGFLKKDKFTLDKLLDNYNGS